MGMKKSERQMIYERIMNGLRVVTIPSADLNPVKAWLCYNGYSYKANRFGSMVELIIEKRQ